MPIDPSIIQGIRPVQMNPQSVQVQPVTLNNPLEQYGNMLRAQYMGTQNALAQQTFARTAAVNKAMSMQGSVNTDGTMNLGQIQQNLGPDGGSAFPELAEHAMSMQSQLASARKAQVDAATGQLKNYMQAYSHVDPKDPQSLDQAIAIHNAMHSDPVTAPFLGGLGADADGGAQRATDIYQASRGWDESKQGPNPWATYLKVQAQPPEQLFKMERPTAVNTGKVTQLVQGHSFDVGAPAQIVGSFQNTTTPGEDLAASTSRGNALLDARTKVQVAGITTQAAQQRELAKQANDQLLPYLKGAQAALPVVAQANKIIDLTKDPNAVMGAAAGLRTELARFADLMGVPHSGATTTQELVKLLADQTMAQAGSFKNEGAGFRQVAGPELSFMKGASPTQMMTPQGIRIMTDFTKKLALFQANLYQSQRAAVAQKVPENLILSPSLGPIPTEARPEELAGPGPNALAHLKANPDPATRAQFDSHFGQGAAARVLGGQ